MGLWGEEPELDQMVRTKPKSFAFFVCWCCCCCHGGVGKKEVVTVADTKAHIAYVSKALVKLYPKYFVPGHTESLNQVKQAGYVNEEREGPIFPANTAVQVGRSF